jgi:2-polyprenyl-3-methyl-5-hydroxy-6-metoxy-1,4-benzoquinol methylase
MTKRDATDRSTFSNEQERWNNRYNDADDPDGVPEAFGRLVGFLPTSGRAIDIAGGRGGVACELAARGLDTTLAEVSDVALDLTAARAARLGVVITPLLADLANQPFPAGPWDVISCLHYLQRDLFPTMVEALAPGGLLLINIATATNLERNDRPTAQFLLADGEIATLVSDLEIIHHTEMWSDSGRHEAELVARKPR